MTMILMFLVRNLSLQQTMESLHVMVFLAATTSLQRHTDMCNTHTCTHTYVCVFACVCMCVCVCVCVYLFLTCLNFRFSMKTKEMVKIK